MTEPLPPFRSEVYEDGVLVAVEEPYTVAEYQPILIAYVKAWAGEILAVTDWATIKAFETGTPLDPQLAADRQAVRDVSNLIEAQVLAATSGEELDSIPWASMLGALDPTIEKVTL